MNTKILRWLSENETGEIGKETETWGRFQVLLAEKPQLSFEYTALEFYQSANSFRVDGEPGTEEQQAEVIEYVNSFEIPAQFKVFKEGEHHFNYLSSTDYLFTVDKYASLSEERRDELTQGRADARAAIATLEVTYGV